MGTPEPRPDALLDRLVEAFPTMDHERRVAFFSKVLSLFGPYVCSNGAFWVDVFDAAERSGVHLLRAHYYSPIPTRAEYPPGEGLPPLFGPEFGVEVPPPGQDAFFELVCNHAEELLDVPLEGRQAHDMRWSNGMFGVMDSSVYYTVVRHYRPSLVMEIGSGFSTLVAARAAARNGSTQVECVEPYPVEFFSEHLADMPGISLTVRRVQELPLTHFDRLGRNDVLFIDSSHVVKSGSDVEYLLFRVLPVLRPGVLVHFHDIYLPYSYPRSNLEQHKRFWNENYVLGAYLANNRAWEVLVSNCGLSGPKNNQRLCERLAPGDVPKRDAMLRDTSGGSLWIRKT